MKTSPIRIVAPIKPGHMPTRCEVEALHIHESRCAMVKHLGTNWLLHPAYVFQPRHSNNLDIYQPARQQFLADIAARAAADRERRPSFQRAQDVRAALGVTT